jgi:hypothetical protein
MRELQVVNLVSGFVHKSQCDFAMAFHRTVIHEDVLYSFGGMDEQERLSNSLWAVKIIDKADCSFEAKGWQLVRTTGPAPAPRVEHTVELLKD